MFLNMKRIVLLIGIALIVCGLSSCTKANALSGTKWLGGADGDSVELLFTETDFDLKSLSRNEVIQGSYVYEAPNVTCIVTRCIDSSGKVYSAGGSFTGVVNGKVLTLYLDDWVVKCIKQ